MGSVRTLWCITRCIDDWIDSTCIHRVIILRIIGRQRVVVVPGEGRVELAVEAAQAFDGDLWWRGAVRKSEGEEGKV